MLQISNAIIVPSLNSRTCIQKQNLRIYDLIRLNIQTNSFRLIFVPFLFPILILADILPVILHRLIFYILFQADKSEECSISGTSPIHHRPFFREIEFIHFTDNSTHSFYHTVSKRSH
jgi:hypothetical protein